MSIIPLTTEEKAAMDSLAHAILQFRQLAGAVPLSLLSTFIAVARKGGATVGDIAQSVDMGHSAVSRQLADIGFVNRSGGQGLNLIEQRTEGLHTFSSLTPVGRALVGKMAKAMAARTKVTA